MESIDRKIWKRASTIGLIFTSVCLVVCIIQYYCDPEADTFQKIVRLSIHFLAVNSFLFLFFNPLSFNIYAFLFYFYGCGNFLDNGNILGAICISASLVFLENSGFLKNRRKFKIPCLLIIPFSCIIVQYFHTGKLIFLLSVFYILGSVYILYLIWLLLVPKVERAYSSKSEKIISGEKYTDRDIEFLERVLKGEKYSKIASLYNISESSVKAQMIELYHHLGVNSRTEFLAFCNGCTFVLGNPEEQNNG